MRPSDLNPLFASAVSLPGIGAKVERLLAKLLSSGPRPDKAPVRVVDLLWHLPVVLIDRRLRPKIAELPETGVVTVEVTVSRHLPSSRNSRAPYRIECFDDTSLITLVFFHAHGDYLRKLLPEGSRRFVSGRIEWFGGVPQIAHPDHIVAPEDLDQLPLLEPVYPMTASLAPKTLRKAIEAALTHVPELPEWQDRAWLHRQKWLSFSQSVQRVHHPQEAADLEPNAIARARLAYDELLANQLALSLVRRQLKRASGRRTAGDGHLRDRIAAALPYQLTGAQIFALSEILADMSADQRMLRLLQGDVGSGKTAVALMALAATVEAGFQGALMAPTEILARQHLRTLQPLADAAGLHLAVLTGRDTGVARRKTLERLEAGEIDILIGTHALFQEDVTFRALGLVVIDEQHRFGVHQRLALQAKAGGKADMLVMTATPIPRTLSLTLYGDMDVSRITEKPPGRQKIDTRVTAIERIEEVVGGLDRALAQGQRAYWVCPLVEESEGEDERAAAEARFKALDARFPGRVGVVHGRMKGPDKDAVMARFQAGEISLLVATTVIEVGVDVPEATIMIIENAERFGLAQLHQLRGRVGRGDRPSTCLLLYQGPLSETATARLKIMRETEDGFLIAEEDLRLRGAGEVLGTRQSGLQSFRIANIETHGELLAVARDDAMLVLSRDPDLMGERGQALRTLLYLFERDEAVRLLRAG
ncbi:ATP-dependent DNA helicase RecG [Rhodoligotrophos appendicifer]|uniref:ATP-dependent DNA helicase RecG n=1 Tax=Rhodoligotrophos appendicifer TaxID=987056 RepID=UPI001185B2D0|nr:ATP-dependent DNA helicase RecG [Rhodoligotrophos appendicifer]